MNLGRLDASSPLARAGAVASALVLADVVAARLLPKGLPLGVVLFGLVLGALSSLTAMGLVIVYRSARIINFAQAEIGGLAASVATILVVGNHQPYVVAVIAGIATAVITGALVDVLVIRRLFEAPRLIVTVATIGLAQVLGAAELALPNVIGHLGPLTTFTTPFSFSRKIFPFVFTGDSVVAVFAVVAIVAALGYFLGSSLLGVAIRGAADSPDRAELLGIPVRRLSTITWMVAAGLSGVGAILTGPILGPQLGVVGGPVQLLAPLTAAVIARVESLKTAFVASLAIGVFQQAVYWSYPRATTVDVGLFVAVLAGLLLQRRRIGRTDDSGLGGYVAVREVRRLPDVLRRLPEVRWTRGALALAGVIAVVVVPIGMNDSRRTLLAYVAIFAIIGVSLVVLTGWSGQMSLGQFAFAGVGGATTASLYVHLHADLFLCLLAAIAIGALTATIVGVPAIRIPGLFLAAATMAFAVPVSTFLLNSSYFPKLVPQRLARPAVLQRFDLKDPLAFFFLCALALAAAVFVARNYRMTRPGRAAVAVRDNARGAAAFAVSPLRVRLTAFAFAGGLAGLGGGRYVVGLEGVPFSGFPPALSFEVFAMVAVGGLGSLAGGIVGAFYVYGAQYFLHGSLQLLATGAGIMFVVLVFPGGLADLGYRVRDRLLRAVARRHNLSVRSLAEKPEFEPELEIAAPDTAALLDGDETDGGLLRLDQIDASYGTVPVLFGVDLRVQSGEIVGLLGTNGAGKSTALRVVSGLLPARRGAVAFDGRDITRLSPVERVKTGLVMVPSGRNIFPTLTVRDNLRLAGWLARHDHAAVAASTERSLDLFPALRARLDTAAGSLSGGEQQMLSIAQALQCRPRLLMVDELSLGLAPTVVAQLLDVVRDLAASGVTVVLVEQSVNQRPRSRSVPCSWNGARCASRDRRRSWPDGRTCCDRSSSVTPRAHPRGPDLAHRPRRNARSSRRSPSPASRGRSVASPRCPTSPFTPTKARSSDSSVRTAPGRPRCSTSARGSSLRPAVASGSGRSTSPRCPPTSGPTWASAECSRTPACSPRSVSRRRLPWRSSGTSKCAIRCCRCCGPEQCVTRRQRLPSRCASSLLVCASSAMRTRSSPSSRPARAGSSSSRACSPTIPVCCCSTNPPPASRNARARRSAGCCSTFASRPAPPSW